MDCTFQTETGRFNYRVGAIITGDLGLLAISNSREPYYYSIGGRVKLHETMDEAIEREVFEETGTRIEQKNLGFIHENFFTYSLTGEIYHEVSFYYYVKLPDHSVSCHSKNELGEHEELHWLSFRDLAQSDIRPAFLKELTRERNETIQHLVERGENTVR